MNSIDLSPLYRSSVGFDRLATLLDNALSSDPVPSGYPPYNIEVLEENRYAITLAVAGFLPEELDIKVDRGVLTIRGQKKETEQERHYLYHGIANRTFERKFNIADFVEVTNANLDNGLLSIHLTKEIPEEMKPRQIVIHQGQEVLQKIKHGKVNNIDSAA